MGILKLSDTRILLIGIFALSVSSILGMDIAQAEQENVFKILQFAEANVLATHSATSPSSDSDSNSIYLNPINGIYHKGDTIYFSGSVEHFEPYLMFIRIYDPYGTIIRDDPTSVSTDNTFQSSLLLKSSAWSASGIYKIEIIFDHVTLEKYFWLKSGTDSLNFDHILFVDYYDLIQENCSEITCEQLLRNWGSPNTTFSWFNPFDSFAYFGLNDGESFDAFKVDKIHSKDIISKTLVSPGEYFYYLITFPDSENIAVHMGLIYIDENLEFSGGTKIISSSTTLNIDAFTSAQINSSSATYVQDDFAEVQVPQRTSIPGCETTFDCFSPSNLVIDKDTTVIWYNDDTAAHTVTAGSARDGPNGVFDSSLFMAGTTFENKFDTTGSFEYFCMVHPWMTGSITVLNPLTDFNSDGLEEGTCNSCESSNDGGVESLGQSTNQETFSGDNQWNTRPTFGVSHETLDESLVKYGFKFNTEQFSITNNHHTDFEEQSINVGTVNSFSATVYADKKLKVQEFLFGIPNVGEAHLAELGVEVWYDIDGEIENVVVVQKSNVIDADTVSVTHEKIKCLSTDNEAKCDTTTVSMTFLEPLKDKVMAIKAIDYKNRDQRTYLNDGFDISGESLNPMLTKMIPSSVKNEGLLKVTQVSKYSPFWTVDDGRTFEMNSFGSFKQINHEFKRFQDSGEPRTRLHSGFGGIIQYEQNRALEVFDSTKLISELPDSFGYYIEIQDRITDEMKHEILLQEQAAKKILENMDRQNRDY